MKFKFLLVNLETGEVLGTDSTDLAGEYSAIDWMCVIDTEAQAVMEDGQNTGPIANVEDTEGAQG